MKNSIKYAVEGIYEGWRNHPNFRLQAAVMAAVLAAGWGWRISAAEWIAVILASGLVLSAEMANTAIESVVNLATKERRPEAKVAKDAGAGMVLVAAITAAIVGVIIFGSKILERMISVLQ